jgi:hypothetical protein
MLNKPTKLPRFKSVLPAFAVIITAITVIIVMGVFCFTGLLQLKTTIEKQPRLYMPDKSLTAADYMFTNCGDGATYAPSTLLNFDKPLVPVATEKKPLKKVVVARVKSAKAKHRSSRVYKKYTKVKKHGKHKHAHSSKKYRKHGQHKNVKKGFNKKHKGVMQHKLHYARVLPVYRQ